MQPMQKKIGMRSLMRVPKKHCATRHEWIPTEKMWSGSGMMCSVTLVESSP